ncbi:UDP-N-acetylmuramoyl-L-alanyl-D-glutamate--2,6-diaminopimelate ligase [Kaistella pullorum]|uniref:UDP-N-acetylmuramoyl-L-alanyl-D-glutamate--2,6-diaminopimelate ligase n=1 Tax=Kaistella pullorum TaxID=2763074 RepID=A0ABR8WL27_9FLAO|nr:UDP-N-acetylmuramoyl-L-alanyl-D-glutamate--2,6-diaminopimelate ligase [Kaistella pullorum]MBD8017441.1 UDP-N-acetylmuramoyl-L-alanyl-D-glutamate--2,6-diaminopimelate ligase [Kaistella pullorum]
MTLDQLILQVPYLEIVGKTDREITALVSDSRQTGPATLYVAVQGTLADGHDYINAAADKGAEAIVCEKLPGEINADVTYILVQDSAKALGKLAANFYGNPSEKLSLIGITGTNGKTSVTTMLFDIFKNLGFKSVLISTVEYRIADKILPSTHTTPDVITLNKLLSQAVDAGCEYAFMEVSSHGIHQRRTEGLNFKVAGFTNISHDHLDYHHTFSEYLKTKKQFFDNLSPDAVAITNLDDKNGSVMLQNTTAKKKSYALKTMADYHGKVIEADFNGMLMNFQGKEFWTTFSGKFNAYNLLLAYAVAVECGFDTEDVLKAISTLSRVKGRFETLKSDGGIFFVIDYAHTPDALDNILESINEIRTKNERLITVFGCGGDRDHEKRPEMGKIATRKSTLAIITSDNPRTEKPEDIIKEIEAGVEPQNYSKYTSIPDRRGAIKMAIKFAEPKDIILVAGKGHENYQEINGERVHFDDKETVLELARMMSK